MPVFINEFEVVPEVAPQPQASARQGEAADPSRKKESQCIEDILRHFQERAERVRAH